MLTPQQIDQVYFGHAKFGGYDMQDVDDFLGPLTEDYITLYKENALLKSKMKVLVSKLEEYRSNEASMKEAIVNAQKTCDEMVKEAEEKCSKMLADANNAAFENAKNADALIAAENEKLEEAKRLTAAKITDLQEQIKAYIQSLEDIKTANQPLSAAPAFDYDRSESKRADAVAEEISANLQVLVGTTDEVVPAVEPQHPISDTTTSRFTNLQFGRNYENK